MINHKTREAWLNACAELILGRYGEVFETHFGDVGIEHLKHLKVSTGFPSRGGLSKVIGQCWKSRAADDETTHHIFINPRLTDQVEVVATLAHEMVHAADDGEHNHGRGLWGVFDTETSSWPAIRRDLGVVRQDMTSEAEARAEADRCNDVVAR